MNENPRRSLRHLGPIWAEVRRERDNGKRRLIPHLLQERERKMRVTDFTARVTPFKSAICALPIHNFNGE